MSQELHYTSAPKGLKPGVKGYCTVASTPHLPGPLAERLESLSGYRQVFAAGSPESSRNPVAVSHLRISLAGQDLSVVSRVASAGLDYTERSNKYAHHVVLAANERPAAGPAWLAMRPGFLDTAWEGEPRILPSGRKPPMADAPPLRCHHWEQLAGDPGWAGVLAESFLADPRRPVILIRDLDQDLLPLFAEAIALVPPSRRWEISFSTYFTSLPQGINCLWRGVLKDSTEATQAARSPESLILNLTQPMPTAEGGPLVEQARTGVAPATKHRPAATAAAAPSRSITTAIEPTPELVELQDDPQDPFLQEPPLTRPAPTGYEAQPYTLIPELPPEMPRNSPFGKANKGKGGAGKTIKRFAPMAAVAAVFLTIGLAAGYWAGQNATKPRRPDDASVALNQVPVKPASKPLHDKKSAIKDPIETPKTGEPSTNSTALPLAAGKSIENLDDKQRTSERANPTMEPGNSSTGVPPVVPGMAGDPVPAKTDEQAGGTGVSPQGQNQKQDEQQSIAVSGTSAQSDKGPRETEFFGDIEAKLDAMNAGAKRADDANLEQVLGEPIRKVQLLGWDEDLSTHSKSSPTPMEPGKKRLSVLSSPGKLTVNAPESEGGKAIAEFTWTANTVKYTPISDTETEVLHALKECILQVESGTGKNTFYTLKSPFPTQSPISFKSKTNRWLIDGHKDQSPDSGSKPWGHFRDVLLWVENASPSGKELVVDSKENPKSWTVKMDFADANWRIDDPRKRELYAIECKFEPEPLSIYTDLYNRMIASASNMSSDRFAAIFLSTKKGVNFISQQEQIVKSWLNAENEKPQKNANIVKQLADLETALDNAKKQLQYQSNATLQYRLCIKVGDRLYFISQPL